jgi:hypothetical protein
VLAEGDTVGIRINAKKNKTEWFVDNTNHNRNTGWRFVTIWNREVDPKKDVTIHVGGSQKVRTEGSRMRGLEYLGVRDNQMRIRYDEFGPQDRTEEFLFPITTGEAPMLIGVKGLRAEVHEVNGASARIKVLRGFQADDWATPAE